MKIKKKKLKMTKMFTKYPRTMSAADLEDFTLAAFGSGEHLIMALEDCFENRSVQDVQKFLMDRLSEARDEQFEKNYPHVPVITLDVLCEIFASFIEDLKMHYEESKETAAA